MSQQRQKVIDFLKRVSVPIGIIMLFGVSTIFYLKVQQHREEEKQYREEENLKGVCEKSGTNLYEELGPEGFFNLAQKQWLEKSRKLVKEDIEEYKHICKKAFCGLYMLSKNGDGFDAFMSKYRQQFMKTAFISNGKLVNYPLEVLKGMIEETIDVSTPITDWKEGVYFVQFHAAGGEIVYLFPYKKEYLLTLAEMQERGLSVGISPENLYKLRRNGIGNFFIYSRRLSSFSMVWYESSWEDILEHDYGGGMRPISNCAEERSD